MVVDNVRRQPHVGQTSQGDGAVVVIGARLAANHRHSTESARAAGVSLGRSGYKILAARGRPSTVASAGEGPTAELLIGLVQLNWSFALKTSTPMPTLDSCRMVAVVL